MSLIPHFEAHCPSSFHQFGSSVYPTDVSITPTERTVLHSLSNTGNYLRSQLSHLEELEKTSHIGKDGFRVCLDVQHFQPNEMSVKTENNFVVVHAKHEVKKDDHGQITREFNRRYELPEGFNIEDVTSSLSTDGFLFIKCPPTSTIEGSNVRHIQIQQTGPTKLSVKNNEDVDKNTENQSNDFQYFQ